MLLLTGATGLVGTALLRRLAPGAAPVRCLVRDPRRLGADRVRVQLALGDVTDPRTVRNALRGARTVVHLAAAERDQANATVEEVTGLATWRLIRAAERAGVERFVLLSPLGASEHHASRVHRAKALAERALEHSAMDSATVACSLVYAPGDARVRLVERLAWLPAVPLAGRGRAPVQPIWADDVAACLAALLARPPAAPHVRLELAGPERMTQRELVEQVLGAAGRLRPVLPVPRAAWRRVLRGYEAAAGTTALLTWDQVQFAATGMVTPRGTADAEALGVRPRRLADVLAAGR